MLPRVSHRLVPLTVFVVYADDPVQLSWLALIFDKANELSTQRPSARCCPLLLTSERRKFADEGFVNFEVVSVESGAQALESVGRRTCNLDQFHLILVDYVLGDTTGDALIAPLRDLLGPTAAIVLTSAHEGAQEVSLKEGADVFLHKPLSTHIVQVWWHARPCRRPHGRSAYTHPHLSRRSAHSPPSDETPSAVACFLLAAHLAVPQRHRPAASTVRKRRGAALAR